MPAEGHLLFSAGKKVGKNPVAASAASQVSGLAWLVQPAPAECEKKAERRIQWFGLRSVPNA